MISDPLIEIGQTHSLHVGIPSLKPAHVRAAANEMRALDCVEIHARKEDIAALVGMNVLEEELRPGNTIGRGGPESFGNRYVDGIRLRGNALNHGLKFAGRAKPDYIEVSRA